MANRLNTNGVPILSERMLANPAPPAGFLILLPHWATLEDTWYFLIQWTELCLEPSVKRKEICMVIDAGGLGRAQGKIKST